MSIQTTSYFFLLLFCLNIAEATSPPFTEETIVFVSDFGATPNDEINDRESINRALDYCKKEGIDKLYFPPGKYILSHPDAIALMNDVMDLKMGENPEKIIFSPYYPYVKGLDISGHDGLELIGTGVELICRGWMEPISIEN